MNLKKLRKLVPTTGLNLLDRFTSFRDSVSNSISTGKSSCLQNPLHAKFYAHMQPFCQKLKMGGGISGEDAVGKLLEARLTMWDNPVVTVIADDKKRVVLPAAEPGDRFDVQASGEGTFVLRRLEPVRSPAPKLVKPVPYKGGWLMPGEVDMDKLTEEIVQERQRRDENLLG